MHPPREKMGKVDTCYGWRERNLRQNVEKNFSTTPWGGEKSGQLGVVGLHNNMKHTAWWEKLSGGKPLKPLKNKASFVQKIFKKVLAYI